MIRVARPSLDPLLAADLAVLTGRVAASRDQATQAVTLWRHTSTRRRVHRPLMAALESMAPGAARCMYCGDSQGSAIDHFEPISVNALRAFDWFNHLLACVICNSHCKRDQFPVSPEDGSVLLIDPSAEDPLDHLTLSLTTGRLVSTCLRGAATIEVLDLNREQLVEGRRSAVDRMGLFLGMWLRYANEGREEATAMVCGVIREQPFACVVQSMIRASDEPGGDLVLGDPELVRVLRNPSFRDQLMAN